MYYGSHDMVAKKTQDNPVQEVTWHAHNWVQSYFVGELKDAIVYKVHAVPLLPFGNHLPLAIYDLPIVVKAREGIAV